jgi:hypothetical protein
MMTLPRLAQSRIVLDRPHENRTDLTVAGHSFDRAEPHGFQQQIQVHADHLAPPAIPGIPWSGPNGPDHSRESDEEWN